MILRHLGKPAAARAVRAGLRLLAGFAAAATAAPVSAQTTLWQQGGNTAHDQRFSTDASISPTNVARLAPAWSVHLGGDISATPTVSAGVVYVPDWGGFVTALNAATGAIIWQVKLSAITGRAGSLSRTSPAVTAQTIILGDQAAGALLALNRATGALVWQTMLDANPHAVITAAPSLGAGLVFAGVSSQEEGLVLIPGFVASFRGSVVALDAATGKPRWQFYTAPLGYTGAAVWGTTPAVDTVRRRVYVGTGNNYTIPASASACLVAGGTAGACLDKADWVDSLLALDIDTGKLVWGDRLRGPDTWNFNCALGRPSCPAPQGVDYDFGAGANLFFAGADVHPLVGIGQKSGMYWTMLADTGQVAWSTQVGPGSDLGGILWGTAVDHRQIYVPVVNGNRVPYTAPDGQTYSAGSWAALDSLTGRINWQVPVVGNDVNGLPARGVSPMTVANGVVFAGSSSGDMVALSAASGAVLWDFQSGSSVAGAPSIVDGTVFWGTGYARLGLGIGGNTLFAFTLH